MPPRHFPAAAALVLAAIAAVRPARAGDIAVVSAAAVKALLDAAAALSEAAIGEYLSVIYCTAGAVRDRVASRPGSALTTPRSTAGDEGME